MLEPIAENLWSVATEIRVPGGVRMPLRMTVIRLSGGGLVLVSPVELSDELADALAALGPVEHIVAPNRLHHLFLGPCSARFPQARVHGAPSLADKRPDLHFDHTLGNASPNVFGGELDAVLIDGAPSIHEVVLFHRASRTLIVTDLVFNIKKSRGWLSALVFTLMGVRGRLAQSRAWRFAIRNRQAAAASVDRVLSLPFERLVPAHGDIVEGDAHAALSHALRALTPRQRLLAAVRRAS